MLQPNFSPFPVLQTERLVLRRILMSDAPALYELRRNKEIMRYIPRPLATCVEDVHAFIQVLDAGIEKNDLINWAITLKGEDVLIGAIGFVRMKKEHYRIELGYMLAHAYQGKGIISEAVQAVIPYGFNEIKAHSIEAIIAPANHASAKVLERAGFVKEAHFKQNEFYQGRFLDTIVYSLLAPGKK